MSLVRYLEQTELTRFHYLLLTIAFLTYMFTAMNVLLISGVIKKMMQELINPWGGAGFLISIGFAGMFFGALGIGKLSDLIGRRLSLLLSITIHAVFTALCGTTHDYNTLLVYRFVAGLGLGGALPIPGVYISEYVPAKYRGTFVGLVETAWVWGALLSLFIPLVFIEKIDWEGVFYWGLLPLILVPLIIIYLPESIRYLEKSRKIDEAIALLRRNGLIPLDLKIEIKPEEIKKISWRKLFSQKYLVRTILLMTLWFILVYTYYGIFIWLPKILADRYNLIGGLFWSLIITLAQIPGYYSAAYLLDRLGRKRVLEIYLSLAAIGSLIVGISDYVELGTIRLFGYEIGSILLLGFLVISFFNLGAWSGLYTYTPELYPTEYRGTGAGVAAATGRIAGILAPIITEIISLGGAQLLTAYVAFFILHMIGAISVVALGIETKGLTLEEISE